MDNSTCSVEGCARTGKITYGWCQGHYRRWKKTGDLGTAEIAERTRSQPGQTCSVDGCGRGGKLKRNWCEAHYMRWRQFGDVLADQPIQRKFQYGDTPCSVDGCDRNAFCRGMCAKHYQRMIAKGSTEPRQKAVRLPCRIDGCERIEKARQLCHRHYARWLAYGNPLGSKPRKRQPPVCWLDDCEAKSAARGMCARHYARWQMHGDPNTNLARKSKAVLGLCDVSRCYKVVHRDRRCEAHFRRRQRYLDLCATAARLDDLPRLRPGDSLEARFLARVDKTDTCWLWTGVRTSAGYGMCPVGSRLYRSAHRVAWKLAGRPLIPGMHLDHLCSVRRCVNPDHLEQVTPAANVRRGVGPSGRNFRKTHCKRGHEFDLLNTYYPPGKNSRHCRRCRAEYPSSRRGKAKATDGGNAAPGHTA